MSTMDGWARVKCGGSSNEVKEECMSARARNEKT